MNTNNDQIVNQGQSFKVITNVQLTTVHLRRIMDLVRKKLGSIPTELGSNPLYVRIYLQAYHSNNLWLTGTIQVQHHVESEGESSNNDILHDSFEEQITDIKEEADLKIPSTTVVLTTCIYPLCASPQSHDVYNCWSIRRICCHCGKRGHESVHHQFIPDWFLCFLADDVINDLPFMEEKLRSYCLTGSKEMLNNCTYPLCLYSIRHSMSNCWARRRNCALCGRNGHDSTHHQFISHTFLEYITGC